MSEPEAGWNDLAADWRSTRLPTADADWLRARVRVKRRRIALAHSLDGAAGLLLVAGAGWFGWRADTTWAEAWAVTVVALAAVAFAIVTWNRRDLWQPAAGSVRDHLDWCRRRCRRQLATIRLAWGVFALVAVADTALLWAHPTPAGGAGLLWVIALLALFAAGLATWSLWYRRRVGRELARLDGLQRELE